MQKKRRQSVLKSYLITYVGLAVAACAVLGVVLMMVSSNNLKKQEEKSILERLTSAGEDFSSADKVMAGPNHAALGELVWNEIYYEKLLASLSQKSLLGRDVLLHLPAREISKYVGQHRCNVDRLLRETDTRIQKIVGQKNLEAPMPTAWQGSTSDCEEEL